MRARGLLLVAVTLAVAVSLGAPVAAAPAELADRATAPAPASNPDFVTVRTETRAGTAPVLLSESALPFGYYVDRRLAERFGTDAVVAAMAQWDGVPGSRWATRYLGIAESAGALAAADGRSVVFLDEGCEVGHGGHAYRQWDSAVRREVYGTVAFYLSEVDIGVCDGVRGLRGLRSVLAHEVGHALGLDHLDSQGLGECRVMYHGPARCFPKVDARDHAALRYLYPTLPRLSGPGRAETAARTSYATMVDRSAPTVVVARADQSAHGPLAATALAAGLDAPLLLATPHKGRCFTGPAADELGRVRHGLARILLVGDWPSGCRNALLLRSYRGEVLRGAGPASLSVAVAERLASAGVLGDSAILVSSAADAAGHVPDGVAGGAAAGAARGPVLFTRSDALPEPVATWLAEQRGLRRVYVLGGPSVVGEPVLDAVRSLGLEAVRVAGTDRVTTALALAERTELFGRDAPVVVAGADAWPDAVTGSALGGRLGAPVLVTPAWADGRVVDWLAARRPPSGWVVGGAGVVPYRVQDTYTRWVGR